jgi:hypothetical protein
MRLYGMRSVRCESLLLSFDLLTRHRRSTLEDAGQNPRLARGLEPSLSGRRG